MSDQHLPTLTEAESEAHRLLWSLFDGWPNIGDAIPWHAAKDLSPGAHEYLRDALSKRGILLIDCIDHLYCESKAYVEASLAAHNRDLAVAEAYILDHGWDQQKIVSTASNGIHQEDLDKLGWRRGREIVEWCVANTDVLEPDPEPVPVVAVHDENLGTSTVVGTFGKARDMDEAIHQINLAGLTPLSNHNGGRNRFVESWANQGPAYLITVR